MDKIRVLLVDDHAVFRDGIRALLCAYDDIDVVGEAADGKEAIAKVQESAPDISVMDIVMPEIDGLEATREIKKKNPQVKVLVLSQYDNQEHVISAVKAGAAGFLPKNAVSSDLVAAIRTLHRGDVFLPPAAVTAIVTDYVHQVRPKPRDSLTGRQREVITLIAQGYPSQVIAARLQVSPKTISTHRAKLGKKLGLHRHIDFVKYAIRKGLIDI